jgi:hypothetical protein
MVEVPLNARRGSYDLADFVLWAVPLLCLFPLRNNDLWWHLAAGREMVAQRAFLYSDPFSFTGFMGSWVDNAWLSQLVFFATFQVAGAFGLVLLRAAIYLAIAFALRSFVRAARHPETFLPALVAWIALSFGWWELRPSSFTALALILLLGLLETIRWRGRGFAWLPVLFLVWASIHPGFVFGLLILAGTTLALYVEPLVPGLPRFARDSRARGRLALATAAAAVATLANPYGWRVYSQQLVIAGDTGYRAMLDEWLPPSVPFLILVLATLAAFALLRLRRVPLASWVPILGGVALAVTGVRFQEYFALVALPAMFVQLGPLQAKPARAFVWTLLAASLLVGLAPPLAVTVREGTALGAASDPVEQRIAGRLARNAVLLALVSAAAFVVTARKNPRHLRLCGRSGWKSAAAAFGLAALVAWEAPGRGWLPAGYVEAGRYPGPCGEVVTGAGSRVFNRLSWGGWLIWTRRMPTFIDGRGWGQAPFEDYLHAYGPGWPRVFEAYAIDAAILPRGDALAANLSRDPGWETLCTDATSVLYAKRGQ